LVALLARALLVALLVGGCALPWPCEHDDPECIETSAQSPEQERVLIAIWYDAYAMGDDGYAPPEIHWVLHGDHACQVEALSGAIGIDAMTNEARFDGGDGACVFGMHSRGRVYAAAYNSDWASGRGTLAHELLHAALQQRSGDADADHTRGEWSTLLPATVACLAAFGIAAHL
jgi:hypothetical protein